MTPRRRGVPRSAKVKSALLDDLRRAIRTRDYSIRTEHAYVDWVYRYILYHGKRHPAEMGAAEINAFLSHLACDLDVAANTQNQALCGIVFLPYALARKYPNKNKAFHWQYVFPSPRLSIDPRSGRKQRHHVYESVLQRAISNAVRRAGVNKDVHAHTFRHSLRDRQSKRVVCRWMSALASAIERMELRVERDP